MDERPSSSGNARRIQESRDGVRSLQFFVAAMAAQLRDMHDKLAEVEIDIGGGEFQTRVASLERERDQARQEVAQAQARIAELDLHVQTLQQDLERQRVTFADHHAAKQEIARLRTELASGQSALSDPAADPGADPGDQTEQRRPGWFKSR